MSDYLIEKYLGELNEEKLKSFMAKDVPDWRLIKVGETFTKDGIQYEVVKWSKNKIEARVYKK